MNTNELFEDNIIKINNNFCEFISNKIKFCGKNLKNPKIFFLNDFN